MAQDEDCYELVTRPNSATSEGRSQTRRTNSMETDGLMDEDVHCRGKDHKQLNRRTLHKLDFILLPFLCALFLLNSLDKSNIGNAETAGQYLVEQLAITQTEVLVQVSRAIQVFRPAISTPRLLSSSPSSSPCSRLGLL
jgi:hypothetical protein